MSEEIVSGYGPRTASYAIVGEAPGREERKQGKPFVGPSGKLLREGLERVGLDPEDAYITNVWKEYRHGNPTPTAKEIEAAREGLARELAALPNLKGVLVLGNVALKAVTGRTAITRNRGLQEALDGFSFDSAYGTLHPAAVLRNIRYKSDWLNDLASFAALVNDIEEDISVHVIQNELGVEAMRQDMILNDYTGALDVETTVEKRIGDAQLVTVAVSFDGKKAWVLKHDTECFMKGLLTLSRGKWIMHNGSFDLMMLHTHTPYRYELIQDTMAMHYLLHPEERKGLEVLSGVYLGLPPYKEVDYKNILEEPIDEVAEMNGRDAARTFALFRPLADALNEHPHLSRTYQWLLLPAIRVLSDITVRGVPVDRHRLDGLQKELSEELEELKEELQLMAGEPIPDLYGKGEWPGKKGERVFNPGSPQQVAHVLFDKREHTVIERTDTGAPSTSADVLQKLSERSSDEFIDKLLEYRTAHKMLTAFINSWSELADDDDVLHPKYKPTQVVTGRLAAEAPNIQQVPRSAKYRRVFGGREGLTWIKADLSQIELRIAAWISDEQTMIRAYREGEDLHALTARNVFGVEDVTEEWKPGKTARDGGKMLNFSLLYGAYPSKLQEIAKGQYGISLSKREAEEARAVFFDAYPGLKQYHAETKAQVRATGKVESPLGRVRTFPEINDPDEWVVKRAEREAVNHPIQSFASDILLSGLVRLPEDVQQYAIAEVHDEIDFLVPDHDVERVVPIIKATMEDVTWLKRWGIELPLPVVADVEVKERHWEK